jgi:DNA-binding beta-propeller fold protein YncE
VHSLFSLHPLWFASLATTTCFAADFRVVDHFAIGGTGGYDYLRFDPSSHRLFVAHQKKVEVLDATTGHKVGEIADTNGVHGIAIAPEFQHGFTSNAADRSVTMFDLATLKPLKVIKYTGVKPDAIEYDPQSKRVYVANGSTNCDVTVIDPANGAIVATIAIADKGKLEGISFDGAGKMLVNDEEASVVHVVDLQKGLVVAHWSVAPAEGPTGLAVDPVHHRVFSACGGKLAVLDSETGKLKTTVPVGEDPDGVEFDGKTGLIFCPSREGSLAIIHEDSPDQYTVLQTLPTAVGCRTITLDSETTRVFMPTAKFGSRPEPTKENPRPQTPLLPDTFEVVVVGK